MKEDEFPIETSKTTQGEANISTRIGEFNIHATKTETPQAFEHSASISYDKEGEDVRIAVNVEENNGDISYNTQISKEQEFDNGVVASAGIEHSSSDTSLTVGVKRLINPDNIDNINNQDKVRKEELIESGERYSLQTKFGYSKEKGLYNSNSLMYRVDDENFLNAEYSNSENSREISFNADLKDIKLELKNTKTQEGSELTRTNTLNVTAKGGLNQFRVGVDSNNVYTLGEDSQVSSNLDIEAVTTLNRNEYGEFNSGLNGEIKTALTVNSGCVTGYNVGLDGAWNYYGNEHDGTSDYLVRARMSFGNQHDVKTFKTSLGGDYRINNCNTIFEAGTSYSTEYTPVQKDKQLSTNLGVYQQVGRNFGDASLFTQLEAGKQWQSTAEHKSAKPYIQVSFGSNVALNSRLSLNSRATYDSGTKWSGEIGVRYSF